MSDFHFIRPWWLLAFIVLFLSLRLIKQLTISQSGWQQFIPKHLNNVLISANNNSKPISLILPFIIGTLAILALAGPTWEKQPQPVYQVNRGSVLIMDMSYSMYSTDVQPNRLTRARFKAIDLLNSINEGDIGLVAYAGDAFVISPLTEDINNIKLLLPSLTPEIMPVLGSNPLAALDLANTMLKNAGHITGDIYWFTDGIDQSDRQDIIEWARKHGHHLNILGIGTNQGAPIKLPNGELMKDDNGAIIVPPLSSDLLTSIAKHTSGKYQSMAVDNSDIKALTEQTLTSEEQKKAKKSSDNVGDQWQEFGPYLVLLMLPLLLSLFRRGALLVMLPFTFFLMPSSNSYASVWQDLWKTPQQQAQQQFDNKHYKEAAKKFKDPLWQGSAYYKAGDYEQAFNAFSKVNSAQAKYNQGNALAKMQKLDEAIKAYDEALKIDPNLTQAADNKALLEQLKKQQQQNKDQQNKSDKDQSNKDQKDKNQQGNDSGDNKDQQQKQQESQNSEQQKNDQQQQKSSADDNNNQMNNDQNSKQESEQKKQEDKNNAAEQKKQQEQEDEQKKAQQAKQAQAEKDNKQKSKPEQASALSAEEQKKQQEAQQKYQQILNKVTDDPYLLLRNKMQLEYQKRRQNGEISGVKKKW
jgi:Ca-activated chloride channel family protein